MTSQEQYRQIQTVLNRHALVRKRLRASKAAFGRTLLALGATIQQLGVINDLQMAAYEDLDIATDAAQKLRTTLRPKGRQ